MGGQGLTSDDIESLERELRYISERVPPLPRRGSTRPRSRPRPHVPVASGRPAPRTIPEARRAETPTWKEQLDESFPLLFFGAACFVMAVVAITTNTHFGATRYPLWLLFLTLGVIAAAGGTASLFSSDEAEGFTAEELADGDLLVVPRSELEQLRSAASSRRWASSSSANARTRRYSPVSGTAASEGVGASRRPFSHPWEEALGDLEQHDAATHARLSVAPSEGSASTNHSVDLTLRELDSLLSELDSEGVQGPEPYLDDSDEAVGGPRAIAPPLARRLSEPIQAPYDERPPSGMETEEGWFDRAQLPPEFSQLLSELYPGERVGDRATSSARFPLALSEALGRCVSCQKALTSAIGECSDCKGALCRHCDTVGRLTSETPLCESCAKKDRAAWAATTGSGGYGSRPT